MFLIEFKKKDIAKVKSVLTDAKNVVASKVGETLSKSQDKKTEALKTELEILKLKVRLAELENK